MEGYSEHICLIGAPPGFQALLSKELSPLFAQLSISDVKDEGEVERDLLTEKFSLILRYTGNELQLVTETLHRLKESGCNTPVILL